MKVQSPLMGVGGWYDSLAAGWLADMRSKQVPTSTTSARRLAALSKLIFLYVYLHYIFYLFIYILFFRVLSSDFFTHKYLLPN